MLYQRSCILFPVLITVIIILFASSFSPSMALVVNLTATLLPGQHPNPEAVVQHVQSKVRASLSRHVMRRKLLSGQHSSSSSCFIGNPIDDCWRCGSNWQLDRQRLAECGIGFGQYALGGKGGRYYVVTDSSDYDPVTPRPGTLRHAVIQEEPLWIVFAADMGIHLSQELIFNSHKTVDGRGAKVHVTGGGCITLQYISNVIIHNIHVHDCYESGETNVRSSPTHYGWRTRTDGDGISIFGARDIWIDHCSLWRCKDGLIDAVMGSTGITISNNHFSEHNEVMLLGHSDDYAPDSGMQVTIAFNHFGHNLVQRMPRCRRGFIHVVNNDFTRWEMYAIGGSGNPTINSQGNRYTAPFDRDAKEVTKRVETGEDWAGWNWRSEGDVMLNGAYFVESGDSVEVKYEKAYSVEPKTVDFIDQLTMNAGVLVARRGKMGKWSTATMNASIDDGGGADLMAISDDEEDYSGGSSKLVAFNPILWFFLIAMLTPHGILIN